MRKGAFRLFGGIAILMLLAGGAAHAGTKTFKCTSSGSSVNVEGDLDADSCFTAANGATVCTDNSSSATFSGSCSPGGAFTGQNLVEYDFVPGTSSCNILGTMVPGFTSCTLAGTSEQGCLFKPVAGNEVDRASASGDLTFSTYSSGTDCLDLSSGPFNFAGTLTITITGGTGKNAGATGTANVTFHGQLLSADPVGNGLTWSVANSTGTITTP
jgi:hypothetical protein